MIKASAGGGGKGMRVAHNDEETREGFRLSKSEAMSSFGDDRMLIERFIEDPHHIEIQMLADAHGNVAAFPERECSVQRRNQKVIEEAPSCLIDPVTRKAMHDQAIMLCKAVNYRSAGTIEMLCDGKKNFFFLEMNTRLQVEHPITELISGEDLVEHMLWVGAGRPLPKKFIDNPHVPFCGWAIESRVYAEDPIRKFLPSIGPLATYIEPEQFNEDGKVIRIDTGVYEGGEISMYYDPMIAKLCSYAADRPTVIKLMENALDRYVIRGLGNNITFLRSVCRNQNFRDGNYGTGFIPQNYPHGFHGVALNKQETSELIAFGALLHRTRFQLNLDDEEEDTSAIDNLVIVLGGPKGQAYKVKVDMGGAGSEGYGSSANIHVSPIASGTAADASHGKGSKTHHKKKLPKVHHRGAAVLDSDADVTVSGLGWTIEAPLASFMVESARALETASGDKLGKSVSTRSVSKSAGESDLITEREEVVQYDGRTVEGYLLRYHGCDHEVIVRTPKQHELSQHMLPPDEKDTSQFVLCPMPGTLVSIKVHAGQHVTEGQEIAVIEAMKMQNVLRSPKEGVIKSVNVAAGAHLRVDQVIIEFETHEPLRL